MHFCFRSQDGDSQHPQAASTSTSNLVVRLLEATNSQACTSLSVQTVQYSSCTATTTGQSQACTSLPVHTPPVQYSNCTATTCTNSSPSCSVAATSRSLLHHTNNQPAALRVDVPPPIPPRKSPPALQLSHNDRYETGDSIT